jgi:transposase InsO family protein
MDFIEGLPQSGGHDSILVVVDRLTKMSLFIPTQKDVQTGELVDIFPDQVFSKHSAPKDIVSDQGWHFVLKLWSRVCEALHIKSNLSTAYHPETDGQTKWVNQILEQYLRVYTNYQHITNRNSYTS